MPIYARDCFLGLFPLPMGPKRPLEETHRALAGTLISILGGAMKGQYGATKDFRRASKGPVGLLNGTAGLLRAPGI